MANDIRIDDFSSLVSYILITIMFCFYLYLSAVIKVTLLINLLFVEIVVISVYRALYILCNLYISSKHVFNLSYALLLF